MALRRSHFQCGKCEGRRSQSSPTCVVDFCLYASVLDVERCADLVPRMFFPVGWKRQPEEGGIGPGCCGGGVITTWAAGDGVIAAGSAV